MIPFSRHLQAGSEESRHRSDILKPLVWPLGLCLTATVTLSTFGAPVWVSAGTASMAVVLLTLYVGGFVFFAIKSPDALRSESYTLRKMAIERGLVGDSSVGLTQVEASAEYLSRSSSAQILSNGSSEQ